MKTFTQLSEDIEKRRQQLKQRQLSQVASQKQKVSDYQSAQREKQQASAERETLKKEIKRELQAEQTPAMQPNEYNKQVARQSAHWKGMQIRQTHGEMEHEAGAQVAAKKARLKAIMSR
jgi:hypothetical protein